MVSRGLEGLAVKRRKYEVADFRPADLAIPQLNPCIRAAAAKFISTQERARLKLYRMYLQASVTTMNRLASEFASASGDDAAAIARRLRPAADWPWMAMGGRAASTSWIAAEALQHSSSRCITRYYSSKKVADGNAAQQDQPYDLRFRAVGCCLEVGGRLGRGILETKCDIASLEILDDLPLTIIASMPGRTMGELLDHPLFNGRDYVIQSAERAPWGTLLITFYTGVVTVVLPWGRLLLESECG